MPARRERPAFDADNRTALLGWYDLQRGIVTLKCEGLSDEDARRSVIPTSPLMTVAGIVGHLTWAEQLWFEHAFLGRELEGPGWDDVEDSEFMVADRSLAELLAAYDEQCASQRRGHRRPRAVRPWRGERVPWPPRPWSGCWSTCSRRPRAMPATST